MRDTYISTDMRDTYICLRQYATARFSATAWLPIPGMLHLPLVRRLPHAALEGQPLVLYTYQG